MIEEYNKEDDRGKYRLLGLRNRNQSFNPQTRPKLYYPLYVNPNTHHVSTVQSGEYCDEVWPDTPDGIKTCWTWSSGKINSENYLITAGKTGTEWRIYRKDYLYDESGKTSDTLVKSLWDDTQYGNDAGRSSVKELFGRAIMDFPKSPALLKRLLKMGSLKDSLILDFFSGSATTAHAVMQLNAEDSGKRKFIMVQIPEVCPPDSEAAKAGYKNICEIGKERIRRAGTKIKSDSPLTTTELDTGFRVLKLDSSNMKDVYYTPQEFIQRDLEGFVDNIKEDRTPEDLLFSVMLDLGILLSSKIETRKIGGETVFFVEDNYLIACFEKVTDEIVTEIAQSHPYYAVFRDSGFASDSTLVNFEQVFRTYSPTTIRKVL
jgi:adenine-specific DNA-methyltransferase